MRSDTGAREATELSTANDVCLLAVTDYDTKEEEPTFMLFGNIDEMTYEE